MFKNIIAENLKIAAEAEKAKKEAKAEAKKKAEEEAEFADVERNSLTDDIKAFATGNKEEIKLPNGVRVVCNGEADKKAFLVDLHAHADRPFIGEDGKQDDDAICEAFRNLDLANHVAADAAEAGLIPGHSLFVNGTEFLVKGKAAYTIDGVVIADANDFVSRLSEKELDRILSERIALRINDIVSDDPDEQ